jgi:DNA-binding Lrp family transcriptional regulator
VADSAVLEIDQVSEVHSISGRYDPMMKCYLDDDTDIGHFVTERIQTLPGIKDTFTIIAHKAFSRAGTLSAGGTRTAGGRRARGCAVRRRRAR